MHNENYFKELFESLQGYRKIVLLVFLFQNHKDSLREIGFSERDIIRLNSEFKNISIEHHEDYLDYVKIKEESVVESFLNK